jgi:lysozyme family protein
VADFDKAVEVVFAHEGGLTCDPDDPGGVTNHGITLVVLRREGREADIDHDGDVDPDDIRALTREQAKGIYSRQWWERYAYGQLTDQLVATKLFDLAVNFGPRQAHIIAQRALRAVGCPVIVDGILGKLTRTALSVADPWGLVVAMRSEAAGVYRMIAQKKPVMGKFLEGWLNRAYS